MRGDLIETCKMSGGISNYSGHLFDNPLRIGNLLLRQISKTKSINHLDFFLIEY